MGLKVLKCSVIRLKCLLNRYSGYLQAIRTEAKADIEKRLDSMTDQLVDEVRKISNRNKEFETLFHNGDAPSVKR